ncbi:MAG: DUF1932 domain-containing protein [Lachnospiraceae bacterium]|nr:DUF1932 domain-containing protein [Lachnospiraceae bacterium]
MKLGYIGYGEAAYAMSCGIAELKLPDLVQMACSRTFSYKGKPEEAGVIRCASYEEMASLCDTIFAMTPNTAAVPTAAAMAPFLKPGQLYVDLSSAAPKLMQEAAEIIEKSGAMFADGAMLDGLPKFRNKVKIVVSGTGADEFLARTKDFLPNTEKVGEKPGEASAIKMLRSLYTKAHLAIAFDMIEGAAAYGVEDYVMNSLAETMDGKDFISGMNGRISGGIIHATRRADELEMAAGMLSDAGLDPSLTLAAAEKLRDIGRLDLKNKITGDRPKTWKGALEWIKKVRP